MLVQELLRIKNSMTLLGRNVNQRGAHALQFVVHGLELSHALYAIRSPSPTQELENNRALHQQLAQRKYLAAICRRQPELWRTRPHGQRFRVILHPEADSKAVLFNEQ